MTDMERAIYAAAMGAHFAGSLLEEQRRGDLSMADANLDRIAEDADTVGIEAVNAYRRLGCARG